MPTSIVSTLSSDEQARLRSFLRASRYGWILMLEIVLLTSAGYSPSAVSQVLFCSRSSVYRCLRRFQKHRAAILSGDSLPPRRATSVPPLLRRCLLALAKRAPSAYGWCRTRWSCAALAAQLALTHGIAVSAETVRRWLHVCDWVWKRTKLRARDDDPDRNEKLARIRLALQQMRADTALLFADEMDLELLPKVGAQWMPKAMQVEVWTPGKNQKCALAGALDIRSGRLLHEVGAKKNTDLFLRLLERLDALYDSSRVRRMIVVADNYGVHRAKRVQRWVAAHPRFELLFLPRYCPEANPIERVFGDVHDHCTRNHRRKRLRDLVSDVRRYVVEQGPWRYQIPSIYAEKEVTEALALLQRNKQAA